ncbi:type IV pilus assembly protein FimV [Chromobacterium violaceum]|uniref:Tfp pilus assembly protein FimV n=3 Tax=Chromobacterium violaceum TaxID=536 RepID=A0AAX2MFU7_CHRVL|nr:pilus assembly protein FimV [Chromobacterium violaceum]MBA8734175.1 pilus assembly protein FimV [Chromobacterium violaceum]MBP4044640.1 pilus assembly protein FimV [Chromobacterium violaceum]MBP4048962.1 pilus assembly protein FimV [Chromobacterium violaceum]MBX9266414.1 pilus assembly protein FimV [Chromobacterium violaceum]MCD0494869.1 pilus assembly protein FimV [Chromobacterium violaceum]
MDVFTALASSLALMLVYYSLRQFWRHMRYTKPVQRGIDPVGEAEVFLAYGRTREAVRVLKDSLKDDPDNLHAKVALLRAYSNARDSKAYVSLARDVHPQVQGQPVWHTIRENGRELAPQEPLFSKR